MRCGNQRLAFISKMYNYNKQLGFLVFYSFIFRTKTNIGTLTST